MEGDSMITTAQKESPKEATSELSTTIEKSLCIEDEILTNKLEEGKAKVEALFQQVIKSLAANLRKNPDSWR